MHNSGFQGGLAAQSRLMRFVYEHSTCNIAATSAMDSSKGLFSNRDPLIVRPVEVEAWWRSQAPKKYYCWIEEMWERDITDSRLLHRAWVSQERILAPRVVHFAQGQIFWECCSLRACETYPLGKPKCKLEPDDKPSLDTRPFARFSTLSLQRYQLWGHFVLLYSRCDLTRPMEDKFIAISALARRIGPPEDYVCGLWKPVLNRELQWTTIDGTKQTEWRAPPWSSAS
jgi:hypothetical protein